MERFVHRQNVEHYREMLKTVTTRRSGRRSENCWPKRRRRSAKQKKNTKNRGDRLHVRFGSKRTYAVQKVMSALAPKADFIGACGLALYCSVGQPGV